MGLLAAAGAKATVQGEWSRRRSGVHGLEALGGHRRDERAID